MTTSATASAPTRHRPPVSVVVAIVLVAILNGFGSFGLLYFGIFVSPDVNPAAGSPSAIAFAACGLVYAITGLACLPGLWRGRRGSWHLLTCVLSAQILFSCYKVFVEHETDSLVFLGVDLVVAVLLILPSTRRHVGAA